MRRWHTTVPVLLSGLEDAKLEVYWQRLKALGAQRVFLAAPDGMNDEPLALEDCPRLRDRLKAGRAFFEPRGIAVGFWLGRTIGHTDVPTDRARWPFQPIVGPKGQEASGCFCPLDARFREHIARSLAVIAESGVGLLVLDDDYRMQNHGGHAPLACFCPLHQAAFRERTGRDVTPEALFAEALGGQPSETRRQWLGLQGEGLMMLAGDIERAVHAVNPKARVGLCAAMWLTSGHDGVELPALLAKLAGPTRPFLRTIGAPYWAKEPFHVGWATELTRLQQSWMRGFETELLAEGDIYPHNRYHCSAAMLSAYQEWLMAAGFPGILNYALGYLADPDHDAAYWRKLSASRKHGAAVLDFFPPDYRALGVRPLEPENSFRHWVMPEKPGMNAWPNQPVALRFLARLGLPLAYEELCGPAFLSGWSAAGLSDAELETALAPGAVVDAVAARWLLERGLDLGIRSIEEAPEPRLEHYADAEFSGRHAGLFIPPRATGKHTFWRLNPADGARELSTFVDGRRRPLFPGTLLYENRAGQRFCVLPLGLHDLGPERNQSMLMFDYARQEQLARALAWVGRRPLPATVHDVPDVHVMCRVSPDGARLAVAVQNAHLDPLENPTLRLDPAIKVGKRIELLAPDAEAARRTSAFKYKNDGRYGYLTIKCAIPPMGMIGVGLPGIASPCKL